ncbi:MAG: hypothetical protein KJN62_03050 [Deltaproteobacteria bacterium]|nr:hypothetical protein [Deltaproteobacteria bacterium]
MNKQYDYDYVEQYFRPNLGGKFRLDFYENGNSFGTLIHCDGSMSPAIALGPDPIDGQLMTVWCDHAFAEFECTGGFGKYRYNYGAKRWDRVNED